MNDRAASVFENYEIEILRILKGRGALLGETPGGLVNPEGIYRSRRTAGNTGKAAGGCEGKRLFPGGAAEKE